MLIQKCSPAPPFCLQTSPPPNKLTLSCHTLPLSQRYAGKGLSKDIKSSKRTLLRLFELVYRWRYPDLWTLGETEASLLDSAREGEREAMRQPLCPRSLTEISLVLPDAALRGCWHKTLGKPCQLKHPLTAQHDFLCALVLETICALLANSTHWEGINTSLLVCSVSSHTPTASCVMPKLISTCTSVTHLQSCWPDGQACVSGHLQSRAACSWLQTPGISSNTVLWAWLHCSADLSPTHLPAADRASPHLLGRVRKLWGNTAVVAKNHSWGIAGGRMSQGTLEGSLKSLELKCFVRKEDGLQWILCYLPNSGVLERVLSWVTQ